MPSTSTIRLKNIRIFAKHGVLPEERKLGQRFEIDLCCWLNLEGIHKSDDLGQTVDYSELHDEIIAIAEGKPFQLIEALAHELCTRLLEKHPKLERVELEIRKPAAPIDGYLDYAAVCVTMNR